MNIGKTDQRHITRSYFVQDLQSTCNEILGPVKKGVGISGDISIMVSGVQAAIDASPKFVSIQGNIKNGYNKVKRKSMMHEMKGLGKLDDAVIFMQSLLEPSAYGRMGKGTELITTLFRMGEGVYQGAVESGWFFSLGVNKPFQRCNLFLAECGGGIAASIDDNYINGPPMTALRLTSC